MGQDDRFAEVLLEENGHLDSFEVQVADPNVYEKVVKALEERNYIVDRDDFRFLVTAKRPNNSS